MRKKQQIKVSNSKFLFVCWTKESVSELWRDSANTLKIMGLQNPVYAETVRNFSFGFHLWNLLCVFEVEAGCKARYRSVMKYFACLAAVEKILFNKSGYVSSYSSVTQTFSTFFFQFYYFSLLNSLSRSLLFGIP